MPGELHGGVVELLLEDADFSVRGAIEPNDGDLLQFSGLFDRGPGPEGAGVVNAEDPNEIAMGCEHVGSDLGALHPVSFTV